MFSLKANFDFGIPINEKLSINLGLDIGYIYGKRDIYYSNGFGGVDDMGEFTGWATLIPKAGLEYGFNDHWSVAPFVAYNFMILTGSTEPGTAGYNEDTGNMYHFISPGISLNFFF